MKISINENFDLEELSKLLTSAFDDLHPDDASRFTAEQAQSLQDWLDISRLRECVEKKDGYLLEARDDNNKLIGVVYIGKQNILTWPDGNKMELFFLAVGSRSRGVGIGQALVKEAEKIALNNGAKKIVVNTHINMEADQRLYRDKLGYVQMGILKGYYGNGDAVFFEKNLL